MSAPKYFLTIIIPAFNVAEFIGDAIDSVLTQIGSDVELLIINDGSTDATREVVQAKIAPYEHAHLIQTPNRGVSAARNTGVDMSNGEYLLFMDGDDMLVDSAIESIRENVQASRPDVICSSAIGFVGAIEQAAEIGGRLSAHALGQLPAISGHDAFALVLEEAAFNTGIWANVYKKSIALKNHISFNTNMSNNEDVDYVMRFFLHSRKFSGLSQPHYYYRRFRAGSASNTYTHKRVESSLNFIEGWAIRLADESIEGRLKPLLSDYIAYQYAILLGSFYLMSSSDRAALKKRVWALRTLLDTPSKSKKTKIVSSLYRLVGPRLTGLVLALFIRLKGVVGG